MVSLLFDRLCRLEVYDPSRGPFDPGGALEFVAHFRTQNRYALLLEML
jgi:hypothetical protein